MNKHTKMFAYFNSLQFFDFVLTFSYIKSIHIFW